MIYPYEILWDVSLEPQAVIIHEALCLGVYAKSAQEARERATERYELEEGDIRGVRYASTLPPAIALSVRQPWAWAIIYARKNIENRSSFAITKGSVDPRRIAIHAAQSMSQAEYHKAAEYMLEKCGIVCPPPDKLPRGCIVGSVQVLRVVNDSDSPWFMGPRGLVLADPLPYRPKGKTAGQLGYFRWTETTEPIPDPKPWMIKAADEMKPKEQRSLI